MAYQVRRRGSQNAPEDDRLAAATTFEALKSYVKSYPAYKLAQCRFNDHPLAKNKYIAGCGKFPAAALPELAQRSC
jgi:hypothetical protein